MILDLLLATLVLWVAFIMITKIVDDNDHKWNDLSKFEKVMVAIFVIIDVVYNFTYAQLLFLEKASMQRKTLTARLKNIKYRKSTGKLDDYWRKPIASFMCKYMIEPWDFGHCAI